MIHKIANSPARFSAERVERDGVSVLCVRLFGHADNNPNGVGRVQDALDDFAAALTGLEVTTLDVTQFTNAMDDACSILTGVFPGLPCCWVTPEWDQQHDGERWDLPYPEQMAPTHAEAVSRVVGWRRAGTCEFTEADFKIVYRWTARGLVSTDVKAGVVNGEDLWHHNRLVERLMLDADPPRRVQYPEPDASGEPNEAMRRGGDLISERGVVVEANLESWSRPRPLLPNWVELIAELPSLRVLRLRGTSARREDIVRVLQQLPVLEELDVTPGVIDLPELLRIRPSLKVRQVN